MCNNVNEFHFLLKKYIYRERCVLHFTLKLKKHRRFCIHFVFPSLLTTSLLHCLIFLTSFLGKYLTRILVNEAELAKEQFVISTLLV